MWLATANERHKLGWSQIQIAAFSGILSLCLFPAWFGSLSLLLSWTASLALAQSPKAESIWRRQTRIYLCLTVCLLPLSPQHPFTIALNVLVGPILAFLLFPMSALAWGIPRLAPVTEPVFTTLLAALEYAARFVPEITDVTLKPGLAPLWLFVFALHAFWWNRETRRRSAA